MKISIITVTLNSEQFLESCIQSVFSQDYKNIEYIIIDGNSKDGTKEIIKKYDQKIAWVSEKDKGLYDAMNKGIKAATGEVIGILNSDDLYENATILSEIAHKFEVNPEIDVLYGDLVYVKSDDISKVVRQWVSKSYSPNFFEAGHVPPHPSVFLRKKVYNEVGLFDTDFRIAADYEFLIRVLKKFKLTSMYLPITMVRMRLGGESNKSLKNIIKANAEVLKAWRKNGFSIPFMLVPIRLWRRLLQFI